MEGNYISKGKFHISKSIPYLKVNYIFKGKLHI